MYPNQASACTAIIYIIGKYELFWIAILVGSIQLLFIIATIFPYVSDLSMEWVNKLSCLQHFVAVSFIKYRLLRLKKVTTYRVYFIIKYLLFLYIKVRVKLGWYWWYCIEHVLGTDWIGCFCIFSIRRIIEHA
jgi:hypothetical protein